MVALMEELERLKIEIKEYKKQVAVEDDKISKTRKTTVDEIKRIGKDILKAIEKVVDESIEGIVEAKKKGSDEITEIKSNSIIDIEITKNNIISQLEDYNSEHLSVLVNALVEERVHKIMETKDVNKHQLSKIEGRINGLETRLANVANILQKLSTSLNLRIVS